MSNIKPKNILYETYHFIWCLNRAMKKCKLLRFTPDFIHIMFGPYICNKLSRWDGNIRDAVELWYSDPATAEKIYGHISQWDVSRVTNMDGLFMLVFWFNENLSKWDVSNVTTMKYMFYEAEAFNQPIDNWNVSKVRNMKYMFYGATAFNQSLVKWDVSKVYHYDNFSEESHRDNTLNPNF